MTFILYYIYSSLLFDFAPLSVIIYFHHKSFKNDTRSRSMVATGSVMSTNDMAPIENQYASESSPASN